MSDVLQPQPITVLRRGAVTYPQTGANRGLPVAVAPVTLSISAAVQPLNGRELMRAPEGLRSLRSIKLYADRTTPLRTAQVVGTEQADVVVYDGTQFMVFSVESHDDLSSTSPHLKYTAFASDVARAIPVPYVEPTP